MSPALHHRVTCVATSRLAVAKLPLQILIQLHQHPRVPGRSVPRPHCHQELVTLCSGSALCPHLGRGLESPFPGQAVHLPPSLGFLLCSGGFLSPPHPQLPTGCWNHWLPGESNSFPVTAKQFLPGLVSPRGGWQLLASLMLHLSELWGTLF